jgi:hypothetical protein
MSDENLTSKQSLLNDVLLLMGSGMVDVDLDPAHLDLAFRVAMDTYRQRSGNSMEESFLFLDVQPEISTYKLPKEVQEVRTIYRRNMGGTSGGGASVDPFSLAFTNNIYMVQNPGALGTSGSGQLATYDFAMQYQKQIGTMFGQFVQYTYNTSTHVLILQRKFTGVETIALHIYNARPDNELINDDYARPWLRDYTLAKCKMMLGEARSKFSTFAGPQGGFNLNGDALKAEGLAKILLTNIQGCLFL